MTNSSFNSLLDVEDETVATGGREPFKLFSAFRYDFGHRLWLQTLIQESLAKNVKLDKNDLTSPIMLHSYHRDRLISAAKAFGWELAAKSLDGEEGLRKIAAAAHNAITKDLTLSLHAKTSVSDFKVTIPPVYKVR